ncbi:hypothetical protein [Stratiformator vulcanicus]|nr:hypothetical protein [Stratiformator vulcanicus]
MPTDAVASSDSRILEAERLKREWTDQSVAVEGGPSTLDRFRERVGRVKTVNMNGDALVEFDGPADISWYDIPCRHLRVLTDEEAKKLAKALVGKDAAAEAKAKPAASTEFQPAQESSNKGQRPSPLEMARMQDGGQAPQAPPTPTPPASPQEKLSPLEAARMQDSGEAGSSTAGAAKKPSALELARMQDGGTPAQSEPEKSPEPEKLSPLELARMQDSKS